MVYLKKMVASNFLWDNWNRLCAKTEWNHPPENHLSPGILPFQKRPLKKNLMVKLLLANPSSVFYFVINLLQSILSHTQKQYNCLIRINRSGDTIAFTMNCCHCSTCGLSSRMHASWWWLHKDYTESVCDHYTVMIINGTGVKTTLIKSYLL